MHLSRLVAAHAILLAVAMPPGAARGQKSAKEPDADSAAIKQVITDYYQSFSRHDAQAVAQCFADDADFTNMNGNHSHGRKEIEARFVSLFQGALKDATRTDIVRHVRFFTPDVAAADADTAIIGTKSPDGSIIPPRKGLMIVTMTKHEGRWWISNFHEAEFPPPRGGAANAPAKNSAN